MQPMRRLIKGALLSASALAFVAAPGFSTVVFAQDAAASPAATAQCNVEERDKLYNEKFFPNYSLTKATPEQQATAYTAGKEYVEKFKNCDNQPQIDFITKWIPKYEKLEADRKFSAIATEFDTKFKAKDTAGVLSTGKQLLAVQPDNVNVYLYIVDSGFEQSRNKVNTYNSDTISYAKQAIEKINAGKAPSDNNWQPFKDKDEALAWMNYAISSVTFNGLSQKKDAAPYAYKAVQFNSTIKNSYLPYLFIAEMYLDEYTKAAAEYNSNKDKPTTEVSDEKKNELAGLYKAYAERAMEAYAKAYNVAKAEKKDPVAKELYTTLTQFYKLRNNGAETGLDAYAQAQAAKPLTDPATPVKPIIEATPTTATTTSSVTTSSSTTDAAATAKPAATTTPAATAKPAGNGTAATTATKPAPKKGKNR